MADRSRAGPEACPGVESSLEPGRLTVRTAVRQGDPAPLQRLANSSYRWNWGRRSVRSRALSGVFRDFNTVDTRHPNDRHEREENLALGVGADAGEGPVDGAAFAAGLLEDVEVAHQGDAVAVYVEQAAAGSSSATVPFAIVALAEFQCDAIFAVSYRQGVREMPPSFAGVKRDIRRARIAILCRIRAADQRIASEEIRIGLPFLACGVLPGSRPTGANSDGPDLAGIYGQHLDAADDRGASDGGERQMQEAVGGG